MVRLALWLGSLALISGSAGGQVTASRLHNHFGQPFREDMQARQGVSIAALYGPNLQAGELRIHPTDTAFLVNGPATLMEPDIVTAIIDEILPVDERGKFGMSMRTNLGCNVSSTDEYKRVTITHSTHECGPLQPAREYPAILTFKNSCCITGQEDTVAK
jgi:hypothetical protein